MKEILTDPRPFLTVRINESLKKTRVREAFWDTRWMYLGAIIIPLPFPEEGWTVGIPEELRGYPLFLNLAEHHQGTGAIIVCGHTGKSLPPYATIREELPPEIQGWFSAPESLITIHGHRDASLVSMTQWTIYPSGDGSSATLAQEPVFEGALDSILGGPFSRFHHAASAAHEKAHEPENRNLFYFKDKRLERKWTPRIPRRA